MGRRKKCAICTCPDAGVIAQVNSLLGAGVRLQAIHDKAPTFSTWQLSRHRVHCMAPLAPELPANAGGDELQTWMQRCTDAYHIAVSNGDSRSAISACGAATRQLVALAKQQEREKVEREVASGELTEAEANRFRAYANGVVKTAMDRAQPGSACYDYRWLTQLTAETRLLLRRITSDPQLLASVAALAANSAVTGE